MAEITIEPATAARFADIQHVFDGGGDGASCQCAWWLLSSREWDATIRDNREAMLRNELDSGPAPGLIAYVDGAPAGWVRVGPRPNQPRLARTRNFAASREPWDDPSVWAVSCFVVRREHRGTGLNSALLAAAVTAAREGDARTIEAYPIDPTARKTSPNGLFHGVLSTFEDAGFHEVARPKPHLAIVELDVSG